MIKVRVLAEGGLSSGLISLIFDAGSVSQDEALVQEPFAWVKCRRRVPQFSIFNTCHFFQNIFNSLNMKS